MGRGDVRDCMKDLELAYSLISKVITLKEFAFNDKYAKRHRMLNISPNVFYFISVAMQCIYIKELELYIPKGQRICERYYIDDDSSVPSLRWITFVD